MTYLRTAVFLAALVVVEACTSSTSRSDASASAFLALESRLADLKTSWLDADFHLLSRACTRLRPEIRVRLTREGNTAGADDYDARKRTCAALSETQSTMSRIKKQAAMATSGDAFEEAQRALEDLRIQTDQSIQAFPTASFAESNFQPAAASDYRAKHETLAREAGRLAADAVETARDASGAAMAQAKSSDHELDKTRARLADEGYTHASSDLQELGTISAAPEVLAKVTAIFSVVDGAIGTAQGTGRVGGNPVGVAREALPSVAPSSFATSRPTTPPPAEAAVSDGSVASHSGATLLYQTKEMQVLGPNNCEGTDATLIRFKDDGTTGCAQYGNATRGQLSSGANIVLIPVVAVGRGTIFDLLYADEGARVTFIGILPGDGTGALSVKLEDGVIVERNQSRVKRSTLSGHRVVAL
jgi:hypothetical protein